MSKFKSIDIQELPLYHFTAKTPSQSKLIETIEKNQITFTKGKAGTGKTFATFAISLQKLYNKEYEKLIIIKPLVEAEENLGHLPGHVDNKTIPFHYSTLFTLDALMGKEKRIERFKRGDIDIMPIAFLRGVTFNNCIIIIDEAQNTTKGQMKLLLTRIGYNSKMIFLGDVEQNDLKSSVISGLEDAINRFQDLPNVGIFKFSEDDENVRNPIITSILSRYEN